jgi:hypothetical protein
MNKLFIIIIIIKCVFILSDFTLQVIHKSQLRGLYKQEAEKITNEQFIKDFDNIFLGIDEMARYGIDNLYFTLPCSTTCVYLPVNNIHHIVNVIDNHITLQQYNANILSALHKTFPDCYVAKIQTQTDDGCCYYSINW